MIAALGALFRRELLVTYRHLAEVLNAWLFFILICSLFPLVIVPDSKLLLSIAAGVIWVAALLATLLTINRLFRADYLDGSLEQLLMSPYPLSLLVLIKVLAHWLLTGLPLVMMAPLLGLLFYLPNQMLWPLVCSLLLGTPILSLIGALGAALTVNIRNAGLLLALLIFPLYVPVLIFGAGTVTSAISGLAYTGQLAWLGALLTAGLSMLPMAIAAALRITVE